MIPFSKLRPRESQAAAVAVMTKVSPFLKENIFLADFTNHLNEKTEILSKAIVKSGTEELTRKSRSLDRAFGTGFQDLRTLVNAKARMASLGESAVSSAVLAKSISDFGGAIEDMAKKVQMVTVDELVRAWAKPEMQVHIDTADVRPLYESALKEHKALKEVESERASASAARSKIPNMWTAGRAVNPILSIIYNHIKDYALLNKEGYPKLLADINVELKPVAARIRGRDTRKIL